MKPENLKLIEGMSHSVAHNLRTHGMFYGTINADMFDRMLDAARAQGPMPVQKMPADAASVLPVLAHLVMTGEATPEQRAELLSYLRYQN
ncbi:hypothetical protein CcrColossus_gp412 [Caulobacter phage CcrColossus]|uniref:Uncharacterized protein n=1 Tax=Caulobacter phage CcrColossus TaxID=1211640 RepID=K4K6R9_9CAUD|nr:hypothetical protein CcrColossus_gp412 [Caulobacter phage CcrColossus]AFU88282.1 hypothetical protein CcrColossus_gp412 [Caulobacter phage CcrColossus]